MYRYSHLSLSPLKCVYIFLHFLRGIFLACIMYNTVILSKAKAKGVREGFPICSTKACSGSHSNANVS